MFDLDKWQEILHSLAKNPLRTFLTSLGVFWGIFMLIVMLGAGNGLENGVKKDLSRRASNSFYLWARRTTIPYNGFQPGRRFKMYNEDFEFLKVMVPGAKYICPRNQLGGHMGANNVVYKDNTGAFEVMGDYPEIQHVELFNLEKGRFVNPIDIREKRKVAIIGKGVQDLMYDEDEDPIGTYIQINNSYFKVVGIFTSNQSGERAERETQRIYVPFSSFQQAFNYGNRISWFAITSQDHVSASAVEEEVLTLLKDRHQISPDDDRAFGHFNMEERFKEINSTFFGINVMSWIVGVFTLLAGAIGITNIMLVIVKERTKEIGIRRAIGAKPINIVSQIITEAIFLTIFAGYFGMIAGIGILELIGWAMDNFSMDTGMFAAPTVEIGLILKALGILIFAGALAGLLPAFRAISLSPVDALRAD